MPYTFPCGVNVRGTVHTARQLARRGAGPPHNPHTLLDPFAPRAVPCCCCAQTEPVPGGRARVPRVPVDPQHVPQGTKDDQQRVRRGARPRRPRRRGVGRQVRYLRWRQAPPAPAWRAVPCANRREAPPRAAGAGAGSVARSRLQRDHQKRTPACPPRLPPDLMQVSVLFRHHADLLEEFKDFLPDNSTPAPVGRARAPRSTAWPHARGAGRRVHAPLPQRARPADTAPMRLACPPLLRRAAAGAWAAEAAGAVGWGAGTRRMAAHMAARTARRRQSARWGSPGRMTTRAQTRCSMSCCTLTRCARGEGVVVHALHGGGAHAACRNAALAPHGALAGGA